VAWSTAQVAQMSTVTSRTLRHYDDIGLLVPAWVGGNGYRYYQAEQLRRLQQILVLRELGLSLETIARVLDGQADELAALRQHHEQLTAEAERLGRLTDTVSRTIRHLEGGEDMPAEEMFDGFEHNPYEEEAKQRWGDAVVEESKRRVGKLSREQAQQVQRDYAEVTEKMAELLRAGTPVEDPAVQEAVDGHYRWVSTFWTPNREAYTGLGNLYVDDARFTENIDKTQPGLAAYLRDAMAVYARARLD
jgi:DNA-binding transcriptional MerR regulator